MTDEEKMELRKQLDKDVGLVTDGENVHMTEEALTDLRNQLDKMADEAGVNLLTISVPFYVETFLNILERGAYNEDQLPKIKALITGDPKEFVKAYKTYSRLIKDELDDILNAFTEDEIDIDGRTLEMMFDTLEQERK